MMQEAVIIETEGPVEVIGPKLAMLRGGLGGTYIKTHGLSGDAAVTLTLPEAEPVRIAFTVTAKSADF